MVLFGVTWCYAVLYECFIFLLHMLLNVTNMHVLLDTYVKLQKGALSLCALKGEHDVFFSKKLAV